MGKFLSLGIAVGPRKQWGDLSPASLEAEIADTEESGEVDCYTWELFNIFVELSQNV